MTEQPTSETLSASALRARRSRAHGNGDHSLCLPKNCPYAPTSNQEKNMTETAPSQPEVSDKLVVGIPDLVVYPDGDPSYAERENPAPAPDPASLIGILTNLPRDSGLGSMADRKVNVLRRAIEAFDIEVPSPVFEAAERYEVARKRQIAIQNLTARTFTADDLISDDWLARLDEAAVERLQREGANLRPVVKQAVDQAVQQLKSAVARALPLVVPQVEQWLVENQHNLARYTAGGGDITPNQRTQWESEANSMWRFAEDQAEVSGGGRILDHQHAAQQWLVVWDWTPAQWHELGEATRPGRELRPGDTAYGVALKIGAKVAFVRSVRELIDRYKRLTPGRATFYGSNNIDQIPVGR